MMRMMQLQTMVDCTIAWALPLPALLIVMPVVVLLVPQTSDCPAVILREKARS
jgi:hypothetical protein